MSSRLADRLTVARGERFVGREAELALFQSALQADELPFYLLFVHGPGGVGKTTLLAEFLAFCHRAEAHPISLDARLIDPSPRSFLSALQLAAGLESTVSLVDAFAALSGRKVILVDTYEKLTPLDGWLREMFLPQLPEDVLTVLASREAPLHAWRIDPGWMTLIRTVPLRNLSPEESRTYLNKRNVPSEQHATVLNFTRGHPLALSLVADVLDQRPDLQFNPEAAPDVIRTLLDQFVQKVPGPAHRTALEVCALVHITTESLLAEVLSSSEVHELFQWMSGLSFMRMGRVGVFPHDLVRDTLVADLRWRNPDWYTELHHRVRNYYIKLLTETHGEQQRNVLFEFVYLHRNNPVVRPAFEWQESGNVWTDVARLDDVEKLLSIVRRHEGEESAQIAGHWLNRFLGQVQVFRNAQQEAAAFVLLLPLEQLQPQDIRKDPAIRAALEYLKRTAPLRAGERGTYFRFWMGEESYQSISPTQSRVFINAVQHYLSTPRLAFTFFPTAEPDAWREVFAYADLARLPDADFEVGMRHYGVYGHDWRAVPPMMWLELLGEREVSVHKEILPPPSVEPMIVLSEETFASAVREAYRSLLRRDLLRNNPLLRSRLVLSECGKNATQEQKIDVLIGLLKSSAESMQVSPRESKFYRALYRTYINPAETQELAAETLNLPFSTYRRYLKSAITRATDILWQREIGAAEK